MVKSEFSGASVQNVCELVLALQLPGSFSELTRDRKWSINVHWPTSQIEQS